MLNQLRSDNELSESDMAIWVQARQRVTNIGGVLDAQFGLFRFTPQEKVVAFNAAQQGYFELTGVSIAEQNKIQDRFNVTGDRATDIFPLDPLDQYVVREILDKYKKWLRPNSAPLLPSVQGDIAFKTNSFYGEQDRIWAAARTDGFFELDEETGEQVLKFKSLDQLAEEWSAGLISVNEWSRATRTTQQQAIIRSQALGEINYYKDVPKTRNQREEFFLKFGIPIPTYSAGQELLWAYFDVEPMLEPDENGVLIVNWERYYLEIDMILGSMLPAERDRLLTRIQIDWTDPQRLRWADSREYIRAYKNVAGVVKAEFTPEEQAVIERFRRADSPERERIRKNVETVDGKLIAQFESKTRNFRRNLRLTNPMLDAKLLFWNEIQKPITIRGRELANELIRLYRPGAPLFTVEVESVPFSVDIES